MTAALLAAAVAATWLGVAGFCRLRHPLDRLHAASFVTVAGGLLLALAVAVADGASVRSAKVALVVVVCILGNAAGSHALGRAMMQRR